MQAGRLTFEGIQQPFLPEYGESRVPANLFGLPLAASLLLHAVLVAWFVADKLDQPDDPGNPQSRHVLEVSLVPRVMPDGEVAEAAATAADVRTETGTDNTAPMPDVPGDVVALIPAPLQLDTTEAVDRPAPSRQETAKLPQRETSGDIAPADPDAVALDQVTLQESIATYVTGRQGELTGAWAANCASLQYVRQRALQQACKPGALQHTNEEARQAAAETFRSSVTGHIENAQVSEKLMAHMDFLTPMLQEDSPLGELAREQYFLASNNWRYLNPPPPQGLTLFAFSLGSSKLVFLSGLVTVDLEEGVTLGLEEPPAPKLRTFDFSGSARHRE